MNPFAGQLPNVPSVKELWQNEKQQYRIWIILFGISILSILALILASIILTQMGEGKNAIIQKWVDYFSIDPQLTDIGRLTQAKQKFNWNQTIMPSIMVTMVGVGAMLFLTTTIKSYQNKNFAFISNWSTFSVGMGAMIGFVQLMRQAWAPHLVTPFSTTGGIMMFSAYILFIVIWLLASSPLVKIRRQFQISMRVEAIKNDPRYQQAMANGGMGMQQGPFGAAGMQQGPFGMGAMGGMGGAVPPQQPVQPQQPQPNQQVQQPQQQTQVVEKTPAQKRREALENMTVSELKKVALELSISGHKDMRKSELIEAIMRVSE